MATLTGVCRGCQRLIFSCMTEDANLRRQSVALKKHYWRRLGNICAYPRGNGGKLLSLMSNSPSFGLISPLPIISITSSSLSSHSSSSSNGDNCSCFGFVGCRFSFRSMERGSSCDRYGQCLLGRGNRKDFEFAACRIKLLQCKRVTFPLFVAGLFW